FSRDWSSDVCSSDLRPSTLNPNHSTLGRSLVPFAPIRVIRVIRVKVPVFNFAFLILHCVDPRPSAVNFLFPVSLRHQKKFGPILSDRPTANSDLKLGCSSANYELHLALLAHDPDQARPKWQQQQRPGNHRSRFWNGNKGNVIYGEVVSSCGEIQVQQGAALVGRRHEGCGELLPNAISCGAN